VLFFQTYRVNKLKQCTNLILNDETSTSFVVSLLAHKTGGGDGERLFEGRTLILTFGWQERRLLEQVTYWRSALIWGLTGTPFHFAKNKQTKKLASQLILGHPS